MRTATAATSVNVTMVTNVKGKTGAAYAFVSDVTDQLANVIKTSVFALTKQLVAQPNVLAVSSLTTTCIHKLIAHIDTLVNCCCGPSCACGDVPVCKGKEGCCPCICQGCDGSACKCEKGKCFCDKNCCAK